jgi:exopolyphosphatase/guanosine-5'-triphosphate,3'-diphosphate pyrophosphatase
MAKRTAIIDIGSNSARLVIFEKTSRYGFHLLCEQKSKVRIGEGAYEKEGYLQPIGIRRAYLALQSFLHTIDKYQTHKTICVATSALRDAPNGDLFVRWIKKELGLYIKIIDGNKEAKLGAIAAKNLLPVTTAITIDIGGGSSDLALIKNGQIVETYSLDLGTVRLKELFYDKEHSPKESCRRATAYVQEALTALPERFHSTVAVGIGGTARTLSKGIMKRSEYPFDKLHAFRYDADRYRDYLHAIPLSSAKGLKHFGLKKARFDTIREGTLIWNEILAHIGARQVLTSSVGVREGVYLAHTLKDEHYTFPPSINPSITSILDRFKHQINMEKKKRIKRLLAKKLFGVLPHTIPEVYLQELLWALKLSNIGKTLTIYKAHQHAFYIAMQELNYQFTHEQMILIASLLRMHGKELIYKPVYMQYKSLLPSKEILKWLSFIYTLSIYLHEASHTAEISFEFKNQTLHIYSDHSLYLAKENIKALEKPVPFAIIVHDNEKIPKHKMLGML